MMNRKLMTVAILGAMSLTACKPAATPTQPTATEKSTADTPTVKADPRVIDSITALGMATVRRHSGTTDKNGQATPPFNDSSVSFGVTDPAPSVGQNIFMWPLRDSPKPMNVKITAVEPLTACEGRVAKHSALSGKPERMDEVLAATPDAGQSAEFPFQMAYIVPSQPNAMLVQPPSTLPPGITSATVKFALDLNADGEADAMFVTSDCETGGAVTDNSGGICTASFVMKDSKWTLLDSTTPC